MSERLLCTLYVFWSGHPLVCSQSVLLSFGMMLLACLLAVFQACEPLILFEKVLFHTKVHASYRMSGPTPSAPWCARESHSWTSFTSKDVNQRKIFLKKLEIFLQAWQNLLISTCISWIEKKNLLYFGTGTTPPPVLVNWASGLAWTHGPRPNCPSWWGSRAGNSAQWR